MHISFSAQGRGTARRAADYLTQAVDSRGGERAAVEVLRGDPYDVAYVADSLRFLHRYKLGCIAWHPEDQPTDEQIGEVLDEFESTAFAGLDPTRFCWSAVLHRDVAGGCHVHVFAAAVDLLSGKSFNIAPPGWIQTYQALRNFYNNGYGWVRPDDPTRMRAGRKPTHVYFIEATQLRAGLKVEDNPRELIADYLIQRIFNGAVVDRQSLIHALHEAGLETPRQGKNYITAYDPECGGRWRLRGAIYDESWTAGREIEADQRRGAGAGGRHDEGAAAAALKTLAEKCRKRAFYNRERYQLRDPAAAGKNTKTTNYWLGQANNFGADANGGASYWQLGGSPALLTPDRRSVCPSGSGQGNAQRPGGQGNPTGTSQPGEIFGVARGTSYCRRVGIQRAASIQDRGESVRRFDPGWNERSILQRQYYALYRHNIELEDIQDWSIWENHNGRFLRNYRGYHVWDKGDKLILRRAECDDLQVAVTLMIRLAEDKGWDLDERAALASGTPEFLLELRRQVAERLGDQQKTTPSIPRKSKNLTLKGG